jgi:hypothetical protein
MQKPVLLPEPIILLSEFSFIRADRFPLKRIALIPVSQKTANFEWNWQWIKRYVLWPVSRSPRASPKTSDRLRCRSKSCFPFPGCAEQDSTIGVPGKSQILQPWNSCETAPVLNLLSRHQKTGWATIADNVCTSIAAFPGLHSGLCLNVPHHWAWIWTACWLVESYGAFHGDFLWFMYWNPKAFRDDSETAVL